MKEEVLQIYIKRTVALSHLVQIFKELYKDDEEQLINTLADMFATYGVELAHSTDPEEQEIIKTWMDLLLEERQNLT